MKYIKTLFFIIITFSIVNIHAKTKTIDTNKSKPSIDRALTGSEVSSGVSTLAALTGDSRVAAVGNIYTAYELYEKGNNTKNPVTATILYGFAGLEVAQAGMNLKTGKTANDAGKYMSDDGLGLAGDGLGGGSNGSGDGTGSGSNGEVNLDDEFNGLSNDPDIKKIYGRVPNGSDLKKALKKTGVKVNEKTGEVTLPDGTKLGRAELMKKGQELAKSPKFKKLQKRLARKRIAYLKHMARSRSSRSGGGYMNSATRRGSKKTKYPGYKFNFGNKGSRGIASVPGKVKMVNGDPLGAASDNVFHIVERAYQGLVTTKVLQEKVPKLGK